MKLLFKLAALALCLISGVGCPPRKEPLIETKKDPEQEETKGLLVDVLSTPEQASVILNDKPLGKTPQSFSVKAASDLLHLKAALGEEVATEKRIRFLSPERANVLFLFGKERSAMAKALGLARILVFEYGEGITFDVNKHDLKPEFQPMLERQSEMLKAHFKDLDVFVCGHSDSTGNREYNLALSLNRAQIVAEDLVAKGVPRSRLKVQGFGSAFPLASNDTADGKAMNRRTEVILPQ